MQLWICFLISIDTGMIFSVIISPLSGIVQKMRPLINSFIFGCIYVVILLYCNKNDSWLQITASILQFSKCLAFSIWRIKCHIFQFFWHMVQILFIAHSLVTWFLRLTFHFQGSFWYICTFRMCQLVSASTFMCRAHVWSELHAVWGKVTDMLKLNPSSSLKMHSGILH